MSVLINEDKKSGLVSDRPWYLSRVCGDCAFYTGEECDGYKNEGSERYDDSTACDEFEDVESDS